MVVVVKDDTETYVAIQINVYVFLKPVVTMLTGRVEYCQVSTEDSKSPHSVSIHVIIET